MLPAVQIEVLIQWKLPRNDFGEALEGASPEIVTLEFLADGEPASRLSCRKDRELQIDSASANIRANIADGILTNHSIGPEDVASYRGRLSRMLSHQATEVRFAADNFLPRKVVNCQKDQGLAG